MIFDVEADGLLPEATRIHVLAYQKDGKICYTHDYDEMRTILTSAKVLIGHNIILYDIPLVEKILGIKITARLIDTLALSWYLFHKRVRHGLEWWGVDFGVPKPPITDWENLTQEEYRHRCIEDVKINIRLMEKIKVKLLRLYGSKQAADRLITYLTFKMECVREQERSGWLLDKELTTSSLDELYLAREEKVTALIAAMPKVQKFVDKARPKKPFKGDGSYSVLGAKWFKLLRDHGHPENYRGEVSVFHKEEEPNPNSHDQIKSWLFSLGWVPANFDYKKDDMGNERQVPQVRVTDDDRNKVLCPSVILLIGKHPEVGLLEGLSVINHRISLFEGFLKNEREGMLHAEIGGFTNTLRSKHRVLVNLPGVGKAWGEQIRGSLVAPEGYELCGSDMCSLESNTKRHYMFPYDPDYVNEMSKEGFDEHLDLAKLAGKVTQEEIDLYNEKKAPHLKPIRSVFKPANYAGIYGVRERTLSRQTGMPERQCKELLDIYWKRNWSVKKIAKAVKVKHLDGEMWLFNPVSRLWYSLRYEKDIFSTLNQGTGVYCFDMWLKEVRERRPQLTATFHDEGVWCLKIGHRKAMTSILKESIQKVNEQLKLNVELDVDVQFGNTYAEIH